MCIFDGILTCSHWKDLGVDLCLINVGFNVLCMSFRIYVSCRFLSVHYLRIVSRSCLTWEGFVLSKFNLEI